VSELLTDPGKIEEKSFEIIEGVLAEYDLSGPEKDIVYRAVHATADFDIAEVVEISEEALSSGLETLRAGAKIITDVNMLKAGITAGRSEELDYEIECFIGEDEVRERAREKSITRSMMSMRKAAEMEGSKIFVIGNAPTALAELIDLVEAGRAEPGLIVATPVGLVGARRAKEKLLELDTPHITIRGKKGGTAAAAAIMNALIYQ